MRKLDKEYFKLVPLLFFHMSRAIKEKQSKAQNSAEERHSEENACL